MKLINYFKESRAELKKVTWPTKRETTNYTIMVVAISIAVAAFIGIADFLLDLLFKQIIK